MSDIELDSYTNSKGIVKNKYPNPFFEIGMTYLPKSIKQLFPYCRIFFYRNEFLNSTINKMATYPITDFIITEAATPEVKKLWYEIFANKINLKKLLISIGQSKYVFGNCIGSINVGFRRSLKCLKCKEESLLKEVTNRKYINGIYVGSCPRCNIREGKFSIQDTPIRTAENIHIVRWAPESIDIEYSEYTGKSRYYYKLSRSKIRDIKAGKLSVIDTSPKLFLDAVRLDRNKIELDENNVFHIKEPSLPDDDQGWGKPPILPALLLIYYMQTLRRGNEAIALEHIVPHRIIFPTGNNILGELSGSEWRSQIEAELNKHRKDPNHVSIMPTAVGTQSLGGDARMLMLHQEIRFLEESIINSLGIPTEFVKGGVSWTGTSVSLRVVENMFMSYREGLEDFLNDFLIPKLAAILHLPVVRGKFKRLRMADDSEHKQLLVNLNAANKISDSSMLLEFGIDPDEDKINRLKDIVITSEVQLKIDEQTARTNTAAMVAQSSAQAKAEMAYADTKDIENIKLLSTELAKELKIDQSAEGETSILSMIKKEALKLSFFPQEIQMQFIQKISATGKQFYGALVWQRIQNLIAGSPALQQQRQQEQDAAQQQQAQEAKSQTAGAKKGVEQKKNPKKGQV